MGRFAIFSTNILDVKLSELLEYLPPGILPNADDLSGNGQFCCAVNGRNLCLALDFLLLDSDFFGLSSLFIVICIISVPSAEDGCVLSFVAPLSIACSDWLPASTLVSFVSL